MRGAPAILDTPPVVGFVLDAGAGLWEGGGGAVNCGLSVVVVSLRACATRACASNYYSMLTMP